MNIMKNQNTMKYNKGAKMKRVIDFLDIAGPIAAVILTAMFYLTEEYSKATFWLCMLIFLAMKKRTDK
jgi:hypothetical protein